MEYKETIKQANKKIGRKTFWPYDSEAQWDMAHSPKADEARRKYKRMSFSEKMDYHEYN